MKTSSVILSLFIIFNLINGIKVQAQENPVKDTVYLKFQHDAWKAVLESAKESGRLIFIQILTDDCEACERLKNDIWKNEELAREITGGFIVWSPKSGTKDAKVLYKKYEISSYPVTLFINSEERVIDKYIGYITPERMHQMLENVREGIGTLAFYEDMYKRDTYKLDPGELLNYAIALMDAGEDYNKVIQDYFKSQSVDELYRNQNIKAIMLFTDDMYSREFRFLARNNHKINNAEYPESKRNMKIEDVISNTLNTLVMAHPKINIFDTLSATIVYFNIKPSEGIQNRVEMDYYDYVKPDKEKYFQSLNSYMSTHIPMMNPESIMDKVERVSSECKRPDIIDNAVMWANEAFMREEDPSADMYKAYIDILIKARRFGEAMEILDGLTQRWIADGMPEQEALKKQAEYIKKLDQQIDSHPDADEQLMIPKN